MKSYIRKVAQLIQHNSQEAEIIIVDCWNVKTGRDYADHLNYCMHFTNSGHKHQGSKVTKAKLQS